MEELFHITLSGTASKKDAEALQNEVKALDVTIDTGCMATRSLDPASIIIWVEIASATLGVLTTAATLFHKITEIIKKNKISGAKIKLPNGVEFSVDNATVTDIEKCLRSLEHK